MTAFAAITLQNAVPEDVEFAPSNIDPQGVAHLYDDEAVFDLRRHLSLGVRLPRNGSTVARITAKVVVPVPDPVDSSKKLGDAIGSVEFVLPKNMTQDQRNEIGALVLSFLQSDEVVAALDTLESIY